MTTPYVDIVDSRIDANSPWPQDVTFDIRNDIRHLKELSQVVGVFSDAAIYDDFVNPSAAGVNTNTWDVSGAATDTQPNHYLNLTQGGGANYDAVAAAPNKMRVDLDRDHEITFECRSKSFQSDATESWFFGLKDVSLLIGVNTIVTTNDNVIGFRQGTTANKYRAICAKAAASSTLQDDIGNAANWSVLKITVSSTSSGASIVVRMYVDGTEVTNSPFSTLANIPLTSLRPVLGTSGGGGSRAHGIDYCLAYWTARPLST